ncbi:MAG TPA: GYD domain-containing protein [Acidimicrobiia bacterium]|nr:GYD domain-containing protein [Acidimicrobiia bacterium]
MPYYLVQTAYTPESWDKMIKNPQDRVAAVRPAIEALGGRIDAGYISFGEYDLAAIVEFPDNVSAAAFSISVTSKGGLKAFKTTPLMTTAEAQQAMQKAGGSTYAPPQ